MLTTPPEPDCRAGSTIIRVQPGLYEYGRRVHDEIQGEEGIEIMPAIWRRGERMAGGISFEHRGLSPLPHKISKSPLIRNDTEFVHAPA